METSKTKRILTIHRAKKPVIHKPYKAIIMSKKYFTKYLPVDGEIKPNDDILNNGIITTAMGFDMKLYAHCQKAKLFLCSRDIVPGDTFIMEAKNGRLKENIKCTGRDDIGIYSNETAYPIEYNLFKKIGEISPDALSYVREDMEFDEDEVEIWSKFAKGYVFVKVKGPCGHFH
jgi:hypothetical protein